MRAKRTNVPEVVFASHKDPASLIGAAEQVLEANGAALLTKCTRGQQGLLKEHFGEKVRISDGEAGVVVLADAEHRPDHVGKVAVLAAGSSDYFVAEEAALCAEFLGLSVVRFYDCGVAGVHRALEAVRLVEESDCDCVIVAAGMEGALPSVIAGAVKQPVIAVPTSVGYGTSYQGLSALLGMLNTCAPGVAVMNIDNGFGAAAFACKVVRWMRRPRTEAEKEAEP